jgi:peptidoglycan hydrolase FlgJ
MNLNTSLNMPLPLSGEDFKRGSDKLDIRALNGQSKGTLAERRHAFREASRQFEAVINQMITAMRKTVGDGGLLNKSNGEEIFEGMLDEEWSKKLANKTGPNSLSEILYNQLSVRLGLDEKSNAGAGESGLGQLNGSLPAQLQQRQVAR